MYIKKLKKNNKFEIIIRLILPRFVCLFRYRKERFFYMEETVNKFTNYVTYSTILTDSKPVDALIGQMQKFENSYVKGVTPNDLADEIKKGRSYHPAIFKPKHPFILDSFASQSIFAVDIDHGNFDLEELFERFPVRPNIVHKTYSYKEDTKRYRAIFFMASAVKNIENAEKINKVLTSQVLKDLQVHELAFADRSCITPVKLFFAGSDIVHLENESRFNIFEVLNDKNVEIANQIFATAEYEARLHNDRIKTIKKHRDYFSETDWNKFQTLIKSKTKEAHDLMIKLVQKLEKQGFDTSAQGVTVREGKKEPKIKVKRDLNKDVLESAIEGLTKFKIDDQEVTYWEWDHAIKFLNGLPIHELFGKEIGEPFLALTRDESNPSARFYETNNGNIVYHDFIGDGITLTATELFSELMTIEYGTIFQSNLETLMEKCNVCICSEYKKQSIIQLMNCRDVVYEALHSKQNKELKPSLGFGRGYLYIGLCQLFTRYVPNKTLLNKRQGVVVYRSLEQIHTELLTGSFADLGKMRIKGYSTFVSKMNYLCSLGLISKVELDDLNNTATSGLSDHKVKIMATKKITEDDYRTPNFYELHPLTSDLVELVIERHKLLEQNGITTKNMNQRTLESVSKELSEEVYLQTNYKFGKQDQYFIELCVKQAKRLMKKQEYFNEEQLLSRLLQKDKWFNGTKKTTPTEIELDKDFDQNGKRIERANRTLGMERKLKKLSEVRPAILSELGITYKKATKDIKALLDLDSSYNQYTNVYFPIEKLNKDK